MFTVYVLKSINKNYIYVGLTNNFESRLKQHNNKREPTTRRYSPFVLIYIEKYQTRTEARKREKIFKIWLRKRWMKYNLKFKMPEWRNWYTRTT